MLLQHSLDAACRRELPRGQTGRGEGRRTGESLLQSACHERRSLPGDGGAFRAARSELRGILDLRAIRRLDLSHQRLAKFAGQARGGADTGCTRGGTLPETRAGCMRSYGLPNELLQLLAEHLAVKFASVGA